MKNVACNWVGENDHQIRISLREKDGADHFRVFPM